MPCDESRLAAVLGELADLGRRISEKATELAAIMVEGGGDAPRDLTAAVGEVSAAPAPRVRHEATSRRLPRRRPRAAPAVAATPRPAAPEGRRRLRPLMPAFVSAAVNVTVILGLAVIFIAAEAKPKRPVLTLGASEETFVDEMTAVEFPAADEAAPGVEQTADLLPELDTPAVDSVAIDDVSLDAAAFADDSAAAIPTSFDAADMLADVGGADGSGNESSGVAGATGPTGGGHAAAASFFGRSGQGQTVCFICDNSNSYRDGGFHTVLDEVARAVDSLRPDQSFFVVFFSDDAYPMFHPEPADGLQPASPENKRRLRAWLATVQMCGGGQGIDEAVRLAGSLGADVVYFLSDGEHAPSVVDRVRSADFGGAVVHTFGMQQGIVDRRTGQIDPDKLQRQQGFDRNLVAIATAHGGGFTPVMVPPQAAMLERLRPIPKNRTPGPVWGTKL